MPKAKSLAREEIRRIHGVLRELFRKAGHGSIRQTERQLGLYRNFFRRSRHKAQLDLEVLFATLRALGVEPADFLSGNSAGVDGFGGGIHVFGISSTVRSTATTMPSRPATSVLSSSRPIPSGSRR